MCFRRICFSVELFARPVALDPSIGLRAGNSAYGISRLVILGHRSTQGFAGPLRRALSRTSEQFGTATNRYRSYIHQKVLDTIVERLLLPRPIGRLDNMSLGLDRNVKSEFHASVAPVSRCADRPYDRVAQSPTSRKANDPIQVVQALFRRPQCNETNPEN